MSFNDLRSDQNCKSFDIKYLHNRKFVRARNHFNTIRTTQTQFTHQSQYRPKTFLIPSLWIVLMQIWIRKLSSQRFLVLYTCKLPKYTAQSIGSTKNKRCKEITCSNRLIFIWALWTLKHQSYTWTVQGNIIRAQWWIVLKSRPTSY